MFFAFVHCLPPNNHAVLLLQKWEVSTTNIRSLIECCAATLHHQGLIGDASRLAVSNISGHSSDIVRKHYLKLDREADIHLSRHVLSSGSPSPPADYNSSHPFQWPTRSSITAIQWGEDHPEADRTNPRRVSWSAAELDYIEHWCIAHLARGVTEDRIASRCLQAIKQDPSAHRIFHPNHTLNSGKLRNGYEAYRRRAVTEKNSIGM